MLTLFTPYALLAAMLCIMALVALFHRQHLIHRLLAINVLSSATFLLLVYIARTPQGSVDTVPHALVLTGIVVAVSTTAVVLALYLHRFRGGR